MRNTWLTEKPQVFQNSTANYKTTLCQKFHGLVCEWQASSGYSGPSGWQNVEELLQGGKNGVEQYLGIILGSFQTSLSSDTELFQFNNQNTMYLDKDWGEFLLALAVWRKWKLQITWKRVLSPISEMNSSNMTNSIYFVSAELSEDRQHTPYTCVQVTGIKPIILIEALKKPCEAV